MKNTKTKTARKRTAVILIAPIILFLLGFSVAQSGYYDNSIVPCGGVEASSSSNSALTTTMNALTGSSGATTSASTSGMCTVCLFVKMATNIFSYLLAISLAAAILFIVIGGVMYIFSGGSEKLVNSAKEAIKYALIGFGMCLFAWMLVNITAKALGYKENWWNPSGFTCGGNAIGGTITTIPTNTGTNTTTQNNTNNSEPANSSSGFLPPLNRGRKRIPTTKPGNYVVNYRFSLL